VNQESNSTTLMLVVVVTLFLLVEFPLGVNMSIMIVENTSNKALVDEDTRAVLDLFLNLIILFSYPLNFFIYCAMSRQFRDAFRELCCLCCGGAIAPPSGHNDAATMYVTVEMNELGAERRQSHARKPSKV